MRGLCLQEVLAASGGQLEGALSEATVFPRVELDPGKVRPGDLFMAVPGERVDGHEFVVVAALRGAAAAVVARNWASNVQAQALPFIVVDDAPLVALQRLAAERRRRLPATVIGITGSVGKTSTKEVVAAILSRRFATYRNPGNRNNEIGLPLSVLEIEPDAQVAVLEMGGAYAFGEIELLAEIAKPTIAVVTNVFPVHLERMGSVEAIASTKAELVEALPADGVAILNGDDPRVREMGARCDGSVLMYGRSPGNDVRADTVVSHGLDGCSLTVDVHGDRRRLKVPLIGEHAVDLVLAGLAVGHTMGMAVAEMLPALDDPTIQIRPRRLPGVNRSLLIDDTYNASTASVLSALKLLEATRAARRIAVLGDMNELGALSEHEHRTVGQRTARVVDLLVTYGSLARIIADEASNSPQPGARRPAVVPFDSTQRRELIELLRAELHPGDIVLLKGSRTLNMEEFVAALSQSEDAPV